MVLKEGRPGGWAGGLPDVLEAERARPAERGGGGEAEFLAAREALKRAFDSEERLRREAGRP